MKFTVQPASETFELNENQMIKLLQIGKGTQYYSTSGLNSELLDQLQDMGLVYVSYAGGSDEMYRLTTCGKLAFDQLPKDTPTELPESLD